MKLLVLLWVFGMSCAGLQSGEAPFKSEYELLRQLPPDLLGVITNTGHPDAQGYIGTHQKFGKWFESGMQRGGCWMLIGAVVAGDQAGADDAWRSIDTTFAHQVEDGGFLTVRKPEAMHEPTLPERVETAFFYLQELSHALLVVEASPMEPHFHDRIETLLPKLRRAAAFIQRGYDGIILKAGHTANRMFIAAKAFGLCGLLLNDEQLKTSSRKLVAVAMAKRDSEGIFIENSGRDSSYNAVSILMAQVLALYLPDTELDQALARATAWERTRVLPTGEVDTRNNTRTGVGKEAFMGVPKGVNYREVVLAFAYYGMQHKDKQALEKAQLVTTWFAHPH